MDREAVYSSVQRLGTLETVLVRLPVRVAYTLPPGAKDPTVGAPEPAPPGVFIRVAPANRRDTLVEQVRQRVLRRLFAQEHLRHGGQNLGFNQTVLFSVADQGVASALRVIPRRYGQGRCG